MRVDVKQGPFVPEPEDVATSGASPGRNDRARADTMPYEPSPSPWPEDGARTPALPVANREVTLEYEQSPPQREERAVTLEYVPPDARAVTLEYVPPDARAATPEYVPGDPRAPTLPYEDEIEDDIERAPRWSTRLARMLARVARRLHPYQ